MYERLRRRLQKREREGLLRTLKPCEEGIDFASNDYLGFSKLGATGSRLLTGNSSSCEELEEEIAEYHKGETALLFTSGYTANLGVLSALAHRGDVVLYDASVHASLRDGLCLSYAKGYSWKHNDLNHLEALLKKFPKSFVVAESIYSTDGSQAPQELEALCDNFGALLILDEAHALGLFPPRRAFARIYTFSKALGLFGAAVVGDSLLRESLINFSRPFIYTTALPFYHLEKIKAGYHYLKSRKDLIEDLHALMRHANLKSPIRAIDCADPKTEAKRLLSQGFLVNALLPPTSRPILRVSLHAFNTNEEYDTLCSLL